MIIKKGKNMFIVRCDVYPVDIMFYFEKEKSVVIKKLSDYLDSEDLEYLESASFESRGKAVLFKEPKVLIWMPEKPNCMITLSTVAHEIFHATCMILERIGIKYGDDSDEAYAYLLQFITREAYSQLGIRFK